MLMLLRLLRSLLLLPLVAATAACGSYCCSLMVVTRRFELPVASLKFVNSYRAQYYGAQQGSSSIKNTDGVSDRRSNDSPTVTTPFEKYTPSN